MSERQSLSLLVCLTLLGLSALVGIVAMEVRGLPASTTLAVAASNVILALVGLASVWGQSLRPTAAQVQRVQRSLDANSAATEQIHEAVNGGHAAVVAELAAARQEIAALNARPATLPTPKETKS